MHQQLALVERAQVRRQRIAQADRADERVAGGIRDRDRVRVLLGGIDAVAMAYRYVGIARGARSLSGPGMVRARESRRGEEQSQYRGAFHDAYPLGGLISMRWPAP